jgi:PAS domain S-box-containing protein
MEELAKEKERTIRILAEAIPDPIMLLDHNRQIIALNDAMAQRFGYKYTRVYGDSAIRLDRDGIFNFIESRMNELLNSGHPVHFEKKDGEEWYEISFILIQASEGQHHNFFVQFHDITARRKFEEQLKKEGITQIEQNMEQFQILNDQIRNPLQAIMGYVSLDCIQYQARIIEQIRVIDRLVDRLDRGWVESTKVRSYLLRHYYDKTNDISNPLPASDRGGLG